MEFSADIDPETLGAMQVFLRRFTVAQIPGLKELVPSYCSLCVGFDPFIRSFSAFSAKVSEILKEKDLSFDSPSPVKRVLVVYEGSCGLDLLSVAQYYRIPPAEVVAWHTSAVYRMYAIGGFPGLPAMGVVPREIETIRLAVPRTKVPPGPSFSRGNKPGFMPSNPPVGGS